MDDPLLLARIQFAANITFHILFPSISIGMAWFLVYFKAQALRQPQGPWDGLYHFWLKIFALTFALGVVSGITMSFQFGTNWPGFMKTVGNVAGPLLAYEVLSAFFLEATFLAIILFAGNRVSQRAHMVAILMVALGTSLSAFWILVLNAWMHTPVGFEMREGVAFVTSWREVILNPSMPYRLVHMLMASLLTAAFLIMGLSATLMARKKAPAALKQGFLSAMKVALVAAPLQVVIGDLHGLNTFEHQPAKVAAMEGVWETQKGAPLLLLAYPDEKERTNKVWWEIPEGASLILTHDLQGEIKGLNDFASDHPSVVPVFYGFRLMVGLGLLMVLVPLVGWWSFRGGRPGSPFVLKAFRWMTFSGWGATLAGWYVTEMGRQPYLVQGILRTKDAVSSVPADHLGLSLAIYLTIYVFLFFAFLKTLYSLAYGAEKLMTGASHGSY